MKEKSEESVSTILIVGIALFLLWIGRNIYIAYEWEINDLLYKVLKDVERFFRIIFQGKRY